MDGWLRQARRADQSHAELQGRQGRRSVLGSSHNFRLVCHVLTSFCLDFIPPLPDTLRRTFSHWLHASRLSRHRRASQAAFLAQQRRDTLSRSLTTWIDRFREARLRSLEEQTVAMRERNTLDQALYKWEARSNVAAAIHFDKTRLKRLVLRKWKGELPGRRERNERERKDRREVMGQFSPSHFLAYLACGES